MKGLLVRVINVTNGENEGLTGQSKSLIDLYRSHHWKDHFDSSIKFLSTSGGFWGSGEQKVRLFLSIFDAYPLRFSSDISGSFRSISSFGFLNFDDGHWESFEIWRKFRVSDSICSGLASVWFVLTPKWSKTTKR